VSALAQSACPVDAPESRRLVVAREAMVVEGHELADIELAGYAIGPELGTAPIVVVVGGITASPFPFAGEDAWWPALAADDLIDPVRQTVLAPCWPGNGSTWRGFAEAPLPPLSAAGLAELIAAWLDGIGVAAPISYVGASLGGMVGLALAARHPHRVARLVAISAALRPDGWGTAVRHLQRELVRDGLRAGDVAAGMVRARQLGILTYRGRGELDTRFGLLSPELDRPPVAAYLDHHGRAFAARFPVGTFMLLSEAIDRCQLRDRTELARVTAEVVVVGVPGDLLFPFELQQEMHRELVAAGVTASLWKLESEFGHDAFLADQARLAEVLRKAACFAGGRPR
jgi:homoserine O-acetyltransferase/O-succinyltransferase